MSQCPKIILYICTKQMYKRVRGFHYVSKRERTFSLIGGVFGNRLKFLLQQRKLVEMII